MCTAPKEIMEEGFEISSTLTLTNTNFEDFLCLSLTEKLGLFFTILFVFFTEWVGCFGTHSRDANWGRYLIFAKIGCHGGCADFCIQPKFCWPRGRKKYVLRGNSSTMSQIGMYESEFSKKIVKLISFHFTNNYSMENIFTK